MKTFSAWVLVLWLALVVEQSRPDSIPTGSVVFPFAIACIFWQRNGISILATGTVLLLRWALAPSATPLAVVSVLLLSALSLTRSPRTMTQRFDKTRQRHFWLHPLLVLLIGTALHTSFFWFSSPTVFVSSLFARLVISIPCLIFVLSIMRFSDELGLRRVLKTV